MARFAHLLFAIATVLQVSTARQYGLKATTPAATQASSEDVISSNVLTLRKSRGTSSRSSGYLKSMRAGGASSSATFAYGATPLDNLYSEEYVAEIEWAGVPVEVIVDSGSSDTWVVQAGFTCVDVDGNVQDVSCVLCFQLNGLFMF